MDQDRIQIFIIGRVRGKVPALSFYAWVIIMQELGPAYDKFLLLIYNDLYLGFKLDYKAGAYLQQYVSLTGQPAGLTCAEQRRPSW